MSAATSTATSPTKRDVLRSNRAVITIVTLAVLVVVAIALATSGGKRGYLDPDSYDQSGAHALAVLLDNNGVPTKRVTTTADAVAALREDPSSATLVITDPALIDEKRSKALRDATPGAIVVLDAIPSPLLDVVAPGITASESAREEIREPNCEWKPATTAGSALTAGAAWVVSEDAPFERTDLCYSDASGSTVVNLERSGRSVTLVSNGSTFSNSALGSSGNAALGVNTLGSRERVVWYLPSASELGLNDEQQSVVSLLPRGVGWGVAALVFVVLVIAYWRGRRFGPVVTEQLPVIVPAAETTEGRARLYRRAHARDRAAQKLREASIRRLRRRLGLPRNADQAALISALSARTRFTPTEIANVLYGAAPGDDDAALTLQSSLDSLEREVRAL